MSSVLADFVCGAADGTHNASTKTRGTARFTTSPSDSGLSFYLHVSVLRAFDLFAVESSPSRIPSRGVFRLNGRNSQRSFAAYEAGDGVGIADSEKRQVSDWK